MKSTLYVKSIKKTMLIQKEMYAKWKRALGKMD